MEDGPASSCGAVTRERCPRNRRPAGAGVPTQRRARMGHDNERAAMIYQHEARGADQLITSAIDAHVQDEQGKDDGDENSSSGILVPAG